MIFVFYFGDFLLTLFFSSFFFPSFSFLFFIRRPLEHWKNERVVFDRTHEGLGQIVPIATGVQRASIVTPSPKKRKRGGGKGGGKKKKLKNEDGEEGEEGEKNEYENNSEDEDAVAAMKASTPNVKKPMMECELHTGEKIMVSLHHNCRTLEYVELPSSAPDRPNDAKNARAAAAFVDGQIKAGVVELVPGARKGTTEIFVWFGLLFVNCVFEVCLKSEV